MEAVDRYLKDLYRDPEDLEQHPTEAQAAKERRDKVMKEINGFVEVSDALLRLPSRWLLRSQRYRAEAALAEQKRKRTKQEQAKTTISIISFIDLDAESEAASIWYGVANGLVPAPVQRQRESQAMVESGRGDEKRGDNWQPKHYSIHRGENGHERVLTDPAASAQQAPVLDRQLSPHLPPAHEIDDSWQQATGEVRFHLDDSQPTEPRTPNREPTQSPSPVASPSSPSDNGSDERKLLPPQPGLCCAACLRVSSVVSAQLLQLRQSPSRQQLCSRSRRSHPSPRRSKRSGDCVASAQTNVRAGNHSCSSRRLRRSQRGASA